MLNRSLYALLWRRGGAGKAAAGVGLHALHHLTAAAVVPLGALAWARVRPSESGQAQLEACAWS